MVLVRGSAGGMGEAHVALLASESPVVIAGDINDDVGANQAAKISGVDSVHLDVTDRGDWTAIMT